MDAAIASPANASTHASAGLDDASCRDATQGRIGQAAEWLVRIDALRQAGKVQEAAGVIRVALDRRIGGALLVRLARIAAAMRDDDLERACLERAANAGPVPERLLQRLAELQAMADDPEAALLTLDRVTADRGAAPQWLARRAECLAKLGRRKEARAQWDALLETPTLTVDSILLWSQGLVEHLGEPGPVIERLRGFPFAPELGWAVHAALGRALHALDRATEAADAYRRASRLAPGEAGVWYELGTVLRHLGQAEEAQAAFMRSLQLAPDNARTLRVAGYDHAYARGDAAFNRVERALARVAGYRKPAQVEVHYAAAKAYEDVGDLDAAFAHYARAGAIQKALSPWSEAADRRMLDLFREKLSAEALRGARARGFRSAAPVFVVGMPRSGTSLVEEIIARHPQAHGAGELMLAAQALDGVGIGGVTLRTRKGPPGPDAGIRSIRERGRFYVAELRRIAGTEAARIVDKLPGNYLWLGLLDVMLPDSHFVHCRRHPVDVCLSQYRLHFGDEVPYSYDLQDLGRAYRLYDECMRLWAELLPAGRVMALRYEDLVAAPEVESRRLIAHLGLPWSEACLAPSDRPRSVRTASATQVRRPIYRDAVGRWRRYERLLGPLLDEIGDLVEAYEQDGPS